MRNEKLYTFSGVHLHYEIDMCRRTARLLGGAADGVLNNILVESYAIHLRTLIEFLYGSSLRPDDLSALDFVRAPEPWLDARGTIPEPLEVAQVRAHKQIAHFTKKRFAGGTLETQWRPGLEIPALVAALRSFLEHADPEKLCPNVSDAVDGLASLVGEERAR